MKSCWSFQVCEMKENRNINSNLGKKKSLIMVLISLAGFYRRYNILPSKSAFPVVLTF